MIPAGFELRAVARYLTNPVNGWFDPLGATGYHWHTAPDGGACFAAADGAGSMCRTASRLPEAAPARSVSMRGAISSIVTAFSTTRSETVRAVPHPGGPGCRARKSTTVSSTNATRSARRTGRRPSRRSACSSTRPLASIWRRGRVFLTEDCSDGRFYRFVADPSDLVLDGRGRPRLKLETGRLQAMNIVGYEDGAYAVEDAALRVPHRVSWADVGASGPCQGKMRAEHFRFACIHSRRT